MAGTCQGYSFSLLPVVSRYWQNWFVTYSSAPDRQNAGQNITSLYTPQWCSYAGPSRVGDSRMTKMTKKIKKHWGKIAENTGKWDKIEEMFLCCQSGSKRLATALILQHKPGVQFVHPCFSSWFGRRCYPSSWELERLLFICWESKRYSHTCPNLCEMQKCIFLKSDSFALYCCFTYEHSRLYFSIIFMFIFLYWKKYKEPRYRQTNGSLWNGFSLVVCILINRH